MQRLLLLAVYKFEYVDLIPYILFVIILLVTSNLKKPVKTKIVYMMIEILIFTCLRYDIGYDYPAYKEAILGYNTHEYERYGEICQFLINITRIIGNYQFFFIFSALLTYIPLTYFCYKLSRDSVLSLFIYIFYPFMFLESMSAVRNFIAISLVMTATVCVVNKKNWLALLCMALAYNFHNSALVALLIFPLYKMKVNYYIVVFLWLASFVGAFYIENYLVSLNSDIFYIQRVLSSMNMQWSGGKTMTYLVNIIGFFVIIYWNRIKSLRENNGGLLNIVIFGIIVWNLLEFDFITRARISMFFLTAMLIILPELQFVYIKKYRSITRKLIFLFFFAVFVSSFVINISANIDKNVKISYLPYQTIFSHTDYERR